MSSIEPSVIAYYAVPLLTAVLAFAAGRFNKGFDARVAAEAALIGAGPAIIAAQNERMRLMGDQIVELWKQLNEAQVAERRCTEELIRLRLRIDVIERSNC